MEYRAWDMREILRDVDSIQEQRKKSLIYSDNNAHMSLASVHVNRVNKSGDS
jgi:hypothetical protein